MIYKIIHKLDTEALEAEINSLLARGWTLIGGIATDEFGYYQAMTTNSIGL